MTLTRFYIVPLATIAALQLNANLRADDKAVESPKHTFSIDLTQTLGQERPIIGFLGGLRDETPDALVAPLHPSLFRIGHQFRGRIKGGLPTAIARVQSFGAEYKLVMSDLIKSDGADPAKYEADVAKLVAQVGDQADKIIWEPANEPDVSYKPIEKYFELYARAHAAVRKVVPSARLTGPSYAFPSYDKYKAFLDYCRQRKLECNDLCWHYTGWDPEAPRKQHWRLEQLRELIKEYPEQKIGEIHCDEWGAGPEKPTADHPGRLEPGRAVVWFYYLRDVYQIDRACRANWGHADDYLGGIVNDKHEPCPAYYAYRWYGELAGMTRVAVAGNSREAAVLAGIRMENKQVVEAQFVVGSIDKTHPSIRLLLNGVAPGPWKLETQWLANKDLATPLTTAPPHRDDIQLQISDRGYFIDLPAVGENEAYRLRMSR